MRAVNNQHYAKYRDKQILNKRKQYKEKNKYSIFLNKIRIRGLSKHMSNKLIKMALENKQLQIELNDKKRISINDFYNSYKFKENLNVIEIDAIFETKEGCHHAYCCDIEKNDLLNYFETHHLVLQFFCFDSYLEKTIKNI